MNMAARRLSGRRIFFVNGNGINHAWNRPKLHSHFATFTGLDINGLHVVESMILEGGADPTKQGDGVLINVRNLFGNEFVLPHAAEQTLIEPHGLVEPQTSGITDFIPHDLNFLNVKVDWASAAPNVENHL